MALQVAVSGPRHCTSEDEHNAERGGELLAQRGAAVLCGGRNVGVMAAVARGTKKGGGICIGIPPGPNREGASPDLTVVIPSNLGRSLQQRFSSKRRRVNSSRRLLGTLSELALGVRRGNIPVIVIGGWKILDQDNQLVAGPHLVETPEEAIDLVFELAGH